MDNFHWVFQLDREKLWLYKRRSAFNLEKIIDAANIVHKTASSVIEQELRFPGWSIGNDLPVKWHCRIPIAPGWPVI